MNGWIFIELLAVSFFLWVVLDPVCVLTATKNIAPGYEKEGRMVVRLTKYEETNPRYDAEAEKNFKEENEAYVESVIRVMDGNEQIITICAVGLNDENQIATAAKHFSERIIAESEVEVPKRAHLQHTVGQIHVAASEKVAVVIFAQLFD